MKVITFILGENPHSILIDQGNFPTRNRSVYQTMISEAANNTLAATASDSPLDLNRPMVVDRSTNRQDLNQGAHGFSKNKKKKKTSVKKSGKQRGGKKHKGRK